MGHSETFSLLEIAQTWHYQWPEFDSLDPDLQALYIAHAQTKARFQAVDAWANRPKDDPKKHGVRRRRRPAHR
jgi:hypothetical protein